MIADQASGVQDSEFDTPEKNGFPSDDDASLGEEIFVIAVAEVESIIEPDGITDDVRRESVVLLGIHGPNLSIWPVKLPIPRRYFPKGTDLSVYSQAKLNTVARRLHNWPRKTPNFETPADRFNQRVASNG